MTPTNGIKFNSGISPYLPLGGTNNKISDAGNASNALGNHFASLSQTNNDYPGLSITKTTATNTKSTDGLPAYFAKYDTPQLRGSIEKSMQNYDKTFAINAHKGQEAMRYALTPEALT